MGETKNKKSVDRDRMCIMLCQCVSATNRIKEKSSTTWEQEVGTFRPAGILHCFLLISISKTMQNYAKRI